jgi:hypothetical protein
VQYLGTCLICEEEKIRLMLGQARRIRYSAAHRAMGAEALSAWTQAVGSGEDSGPDVKEASCYRSRYDVLSCVFIIYRRLRHIFI